MENKNRMINTRLWVDGYFADLDPSEKLAWLYILTNPYTNICGIYELPLKFMAIETGIDRDMIIKILTRFETDGKILYRDGWLAIKNFIKYQNLTGDSIKHGVNKALISAPAELVSWVITDTPLTPSIHPPDTLTPPSLIKEKKRKELKRKEKNIPASGEKPAADTLGKRAAVICKLFYEAYKTAGRGEYIASFAADNKIMQQLCAVMTDADLKECIASYLLSNDAYYKKAGHNITCFRGSINAIKAQTLKAAPTKKDYAAGWEGL